MDIRYKSLKLTDNSKVRGYKGHANTFSLKRGLPSNGGACPGATAGEGGCLDVCYAENLRRLYKSYAAVEDFNMELIRDLDYDDLVIVLDNTVQKWALSGGGAIPYFRIHTSGDFYSEEYARAWATVINRHTDIHFWTYTRSMFAVKHLLYRSNLTLMLSCDTVNLSEVVDKYHGFLLWKPVKLYTTKVAVAWMGNEIPAELEVILDKPVLVCPAVTKTMAKQGDAGVCMRCRCCIDRTLKDGSIRHIQFPIHR